MIDFETLNILNKETKSEIDNFIFAYIMNIYMW